MNSKTLRYGMVGGGPDAFIGGVHRTAAAFDPRSRLVAGCFSRDSGKNAEAGRLCCIDPDRTYASYQEMASAEAAREDGISFVSIVTPNNAHYDIAKAFLHSGINILCEKPLCFTPQEAQELVDLAKAKDLLFGVGYTYSGYPMVKMARELVQSGKVGEILNINAQYPQEWLIDKIEGSKSDTAKFSGWRDVPEVAGISNCTGDIGTHIENIVHYVAGLKIKRLAASTDYYGDSLDLNANILLEYENGAKGNYWCSQVAIGHRNDLVFRIYGTKAAVEWHQEEPECLRVTYKGQPEQRYYRGAGYIEGAAAETARIPSGHIEGYHAAFANVYRSYMNAIEKKLAGQALGDADIDFATAEDGLNGVRFIHAVVESGKNDCAWVQL